MSVHLHWSDQTCHINGMYYSRIPFLLDRNYDLVEAPTDWFRYLVTKSRLSKDTCMQYAYTLTAFFNYLSGRRIDWRAVNDFVLEEWRGTLIGDKNSPVSNMTWNRSLAVILKYFNWAQAHGHIVDFIGECENGRIRPLSVEMKIVGGRHVIKSVLSLRSNARFRPIPTDREMEDAYAELSNTRSDLAARNVLLLRWAEAGLRRDEFRCMKISDLPSLSEINDAESRDQPCLINVAGKGSKLRTMAVDPDLILATRDYIQVERNEAMKRKGAAAAEDFIFVSHSDGRLLSRSRISHLLSDSFRNSDRYEVLSGHRARGRHLTKLCEAYIDEHIHTFGTIDGLSTDTILFRVAEQAGHSDLRSLRYYLRLALRTRYQRNSQKLMHPKPGH